MRKDTKKPVPKPVEAPKPDLSRADHDIVPMSSQERKRIRYEAFLAEVKAADKAREKVD